MQWEPFDPQWLVRLAEVQHPDKPWLAEALSACTSCHWKRSKKYVYFVDPADANRPGAAWQFEQHIWLQDPSEGNLLLDVLSGLRIGGVEFYDQLFSSWKRSKAL